MNVGQVGSPGWAHRAQYGLPPGKHLSTRLDKIEPGQETAAADAPEGAKAPKGVIRLLLAGHFKGVANVRLRINFHDELAAAGIREAGPAVSGSLGTLTDELGAVIEELLSLGTLTEEESAQATAAHEAFNAAVKGLLEEFESSEERNTDALMAGVQAEFETLYDFFVALFGLDSESIEVDPEEELVDAAASDTPPLEPGPAEAEPFTIVPEEEGLHVAMQQLFDKLAEIFAAARESLGIEFAEATFLPPLSEPNGNGVAYAKFLAVYNELQGLDHDADSVPQETLSLVG